MKLIMENWRSYLQELRVTKPAKPCKHSCDPCFEWYEYFRNPGDGSLLRQKKAAAVKAGCFNYPDPGRCYKEYRKYAACRQAQEGSGWPPDCDPCKDIS